MIIKYEMRGTGPHGQHSEWVEFCGEFASWEVFAQFKFREQQMNFREVRNAKEVEKQP